MRTAKPRHCGVIQYEAGFVEPIAVATVTPSSESAIAHIVKLKNNELAKRLKRQAKSGVVTTQGDILPSPWVTSRLFEHKAVML